jgi:hypothetical protein
MAAIEISMVMSIFPKEGRTLLDHMSAIKIENVAAKTTNWKKPRHISTPPPTSNLSASVKYDWPFLEYFLHSIYQ